MRSPSKPIRCLRPWFCATPRATSSTPAPAAANLPRIFPSISFRSLTPDYPPAEIKIRPQRKAAVVRPQRLRDHLSRFADAWSKTNRKCSVSSRSTACPSTPSQTTRKKIIWQSHILLPPASRVGIHREGPGRRRSGQPDHAGGGHRPSRRKRPDAPARRDCRRTRCSRASVQLAASPAPLPRTNRRMAGRSQARTNPETLFLRETA